MKFKLMKNTKTGVIMRYNEDACTRMTNLQPLSPSEVTNEEIEAAGLKGYAEGLVTEAEVEILTPETVTQEEADNLIDTSKWDEKQLDEFIEANEIPLHPAAKIAGKQKAVARFFENQDKDEVGE